ncbi:MAG: hypothetical protein Q8O89_03585 [Nanoarchaeota archaeon]|nr:hypothetical protein [Nanoarchaeota archaeon]
MPKNDTPEKVYDDLLSKGFYIDTELDNEEIKKRLIMAAEDYLTGKEYRKGPAINYRIIFNIHYDVIRELCEILMASKERKISNHQGLFAFIILNFPELDFDWNFLEEIRTIRNRNKYDGIDITKETWKHVELPFDLYISALKKEIETKLKNL